MNASKFQLHYFIAESSDEKSSWLKDLYLVSVLPNDNFSRSGKSTTTAASRSAKASAALIYSFICCFPGYSWAQLY